MTQLTQDISTITTIPKSQVDNLLSKVRLILCHNLSECLLRGDETPTIDIGIGVLQFGITDQNIKYRFIPSSIFEQQIKETATTGDSPLITQVETLLRERITNTYKDLI